MGFEFTQQGGIEGRVRDMARDQIDKALEECRQDDIAFADLVHKLRRRCKRLRGLVRLIKPHFKHWKQEDRAFRDAAKGLSGTRDAAVLVQTFETLLKFDGERGARIETDRGECLTAWLKGRVAEAPTGGERDEFLKDFMELFSASGRRAKDWSLSGRGFNQIADGLEDTYRRMRDGLTLAESEQTPEALHGWRKDTKYHWHHVSVLNESAPELLRPRKSSLDRLGDMLGDHHNLAVLDEALAEQDDIGTIREVIAERQVILAFDALHLGRQLVAEKPAMLRDRFEQYWSLLPEKD